MLTANRPEAGGSLMEGPHRGGRAGPGGMDRPAPSAPGPAATEAAVPAAARDQ